MSRRANRPDVMVGFDFNLNMAHYAGHRGEDDRDGAVHGHTYIVTVLFSGAPDPQSGYVVDMRDVEARIAEISAELDGRIMNDVPGMGHSMETLALWIAERFGEISPGRLHSVEVARPSCRMTARYVL